MNDFVVQSFYFIEFHGFSILILISYYQKNLIFIPVSKEVYYPKSVQELEAKLLKIDEMFVNGDLEKDSYQRMKTSTKDEIQRLQIQLSRLKNTDSNYVKYCRYGLSLLGNLQVHYQKASPYIRKKLLGSIFTGKLIFENGNYRTTGLNEAVALIGQFQQEFEHKKTEHLAISDKTFGNVPLRGRF